MGAESKSDRGHPPGLFCINIAISNAFLPHTDADAALGFYRDLLGFELRQDVGYENLRWLTVGPVGRPGLRGAGLRRSRPRG